MTSPIKTYYPPTYDTPKLEQPQPKPITAPPGYYINGYGNLLPIPPVKMETPPVPQPYYPPPPDNPIKFMPGYYDNGNGMGQPIPSTFAPPPTIFDPVPTTDISDPYKQLQFSNPQNLQTNDIRSFVNANIGDPATIASAMQQYGLNATDVAQAMGVDPSVVTSYLGYETLPQPDTSITPTQYTETPLTYSTPPTPEYLTPPMETPKEQPNIYYPEAPQPNPDMSQLATLPDGSQVYTGQ
jgi:hypothetical protein